MDTVEFKVYGDFEQALADRFLAFMASLKAPCMVVLDIESCGGYVEVLRQMESVISQKKAEGCVFTTNVENYAYSCGLFLFILGDLRFCSDSARFLYHSAGLDIFCERLNSTDLADMLEMLQRDDELTDRILAENTTIQPEMLEILKKNDNFLTKSDLIFLGFMEKEYELI
jgi:ATP-dependent protease ClpP protease subunit